MDYGYYADLDTATGYWVIRHTDSEVPFAQFLTQEEAEDNAPARNRAGADRHRRVQVQTW